MSLDPETINSILRTIEGLGMKATLVYLLKEGINLVKDDAYQKIKELIKQKSEKKLEKQFGFMPDKNEANSLKRFGNNEYFKEFNKLLPNHPHSDWIRVGYLISFLNKTRGDMNRIKEIRERI